MFHNIWMHHLIPNHPHKVVYGKQEILTRLEIAWYTNFKIISFCDFLTALILTALCQLRGRCYNAGEWAKDGMVWLHYCDIGKLISCPCASYSCLWNWRELKPHFFHNVVILPVQRITFQDRTMQSKALPMKNNKAIINVMHFLASVCKSDFMVINCCGPMERIAEDPGFQKWGKIWFYRKNLQMISKWNHLLLPKETIRLNKILKCLIFSNGKIKQDQ